MTPHASGPVPSRRAQAARRRALRPPIVVLVAVAALVLAALGPGEAAAKGKKRKAKAKDQYHFVLREVKVGGDVDPALAADAVRLLEAEAKKAFAAHEQLATDLADAPDPEAAPDAYRTYLGKKKIKAAYKVDVDLTLYREEVEDAPTGSGKDAKRIVVRMELHMFGETMPGRKMGFEGKGSSTVKQDVGKKVRPRDREFTIQSAVELAVADAIATSMVELSKPAAKPSKK